MKAVKISVDCIMIVLLPLLMAYSLIGEQLHEWLGIGMFLVFIIHHILNRKWILSVFKGRYTPYRVYMTTVNAALMLIMILLPISGIMMSRYAVPFLSVAGMALTARTVHMLTAYWGLVLMSMHMGIHGRMMMGGLRKMFKIKKPSAARTAVLRASAAGIFIYGIYAAAKRQVFGYMTGRIMFAFFDSSENRAFFFIDYIFIIAAFAVTGYYIGELIKALGRSGNSGKDSHDSRDPQ